MASQQAHQSHWREDGTCSYCGSLSPALFFEAIKNGCELGPTDKDYKVYVDRPDPEVGIPWVYGMANFEQTGPGWVQVTTENQDTLPKTGMPLTLGHWVQVEPKQAIKHDKFYFYHLNREERIQFVVLLNAGQVKVGVPGFFYQLPFFMKKVGAEAPTPLP